MIFFSHLLHCIKIIFYFIKKLFMKKFSTSFLVLSITLFISSCSSNNQSAENTNSAPKTDSTSFDMDKAKSAIADINAKFSDELKKGDSAALALHYSSDAYVMPPNSEPVPKDKIVSVWGGAIRMGVKDIKLTTDDVTGNGELAGETGKY